MIFKVKRFWGNMVRSIEWKTRLFFQGKLDLEKLTTANGNRVIVVFENAEMAESMKANNTHLGFQDDMRRGFGSEIVIPKNEPVYLLMNTDYEGRGMSQSDFSQWEKDKNWFHEETSSPGLIVLSLNVLTNDGVIRPVDGSQFLEPTDEELSELQQDFREAISISNKNRLVCRYCLAKSCLIRHESFDIKALREAIAAEKILEKTPE